MRTILYAIFAAISILLPISCMTRHDNNGFPSKVKFSKAGGRIVIYGNSPIYFSNLEMYEGSQWWYGEMDCNDKTVSREEEGNCTHSLNSDWFTLIHRPHTDSLVLIASPNNTGKKRNCHINAYYNGHYFAVINIQQGK